MNILRKLDPRPLIECVACGWPESDWRPTGYYRDGVTPCGLCRGTKQIRWSHRKLFGRWVRVARG